MLSQLQIKSITPIAIKSGEALEPTEYFVDKNKPILHVIDFKKYLKTLNAEHRRTFEKIASASIVEVRKFIRYTFDENSILYSINISNNFKKYYEEQFENNRAELTINLHSRTANNPFVPGSSVKGVIRTAIIFSLFSEQEREKYTKQILNTRERSDPFFEPDILKYSYFDDRKNKKNFDLSQDPFRTLKISDSLNPDIKTTVHRLIVVGNKTGFEPTEISELTECINLNTVSNHSISIDEEILKDPKFKIKLSKDIIIASLKVFAEAQLKHQEEFFKKNKTSNLNHLTTELLDILNKNKDNKNFALIRIGYGSGYYASSVGLKMFPVPEKKSKKTLEEQYLLGWAMLTIK